MKLHLIVLFSLCIVVNCLRAAQDEGEKVDAADPLRGWDVTEAERAALISFDKDEEEKVDAASLNAELAASLNPKPLIGDPNPARPKKRTKKRRLSVIRTQEEEEKEAKKRKANLLDFLLASGHSEYDILTALENTSLPCSKVQPCLDDAIRISGNCFFNRETGEVIPSWGLHGAALKGVKDTYSHWHRKYPLCSCSTQL